MSCLFHLQIKNPPKKHKVWVWHVVGFRCYFRHSHLSCSHSQCQAKLIWAKITQLLALASYLRDRTKNGIFFPANFCQNKMSNYFKQFIVLFFSFWKQDIWLLSLTPRSSRLCALGWLFTSLSMWRWGYETKQLAIFPREVTFCCFKHTAGIFLFAPGLLINFHYSTSDFLHIHSPTIYGLHETSGLWDGRKSDNTAHTSLKPLTLSQEMFGGMTSGLLFFSIGVWPSPC